MEQENNKENYINRRAENLGALAISLAMLFFLALGLLFYYQFYQGDGKWKFTLKHKVNDAVFLASLTPQLKELQAINDSLKKQKPDTIKVIKTVEVPAPVVDPVFEEPIVEEPENDVYTPDPDKKYVVQIGAFKSFDLSRFQPGMESMEQHKVNGLNTVTIGRFTTQKEAELFSKDIAALGIKSPLVAKMDNGKPVVIKPKTVTKPVAKKPVAKKKTVKKKTVAKKPVKKKTTR